MKIGTMPKVLNESETVAFGLVRHRNYVGMCCTWVIDGYFKEGFPFILNTKLRHARYEISSNIIIQVFPVIYPMITIYKYNSYLLQVSTMYTNRIIH